MWLSSSQKTGVGLTVSGLLSMLLGIAMLFDGGLLAIGNLLFLAGLLLLIGAQRTVAFFSRPTKLRGSLCFFGGIALVLLRRPFVGVCVEMFGFINLFG
ncbi:hypothetical protein BC830DRAFT_811431 [Chytriomyces sp. MP71]|nr:hypothetical protein BC830DRAFT_811431 [Chytriomyces sp. MP71]